MADPAAQSPFVSSSSAPSEPAGPACRRHGSPACADPLVSSSQPVSLFAASPASEAASGGGEGKPPLQPSSPDAFAPLSSSSQGEAHREKDSPESPFELVLDRAAFDREYAAAMLGERAALSQIPEDQICDFSSKPRGVASTAKSPALGRQSSGTAAALEEVSKCVREMHSFTSELLSWDWVERGDGPPPGEDSSGDSDDTVIEDDGERGDGAASLPAAQQCSGGAVPMEAPRVERGVGGPAALRQRNGGAAVPTGGPGGGGGDVEAPPALQPRNSMVLMESPPIKCGDLESAPAPQHHDSGSVVPMEGPHVGGGDVEAALALQRGGPVPPMESPPIEHGDVEPAPAPQPRKGTRVVPMEAPPHQRALGSPQPERNAPKSGVPPKTAPPDMEQVTLRALREAMETPPGPPTPPGTPCLLPPLAVHDLIFWRDVRRSGAVFASSLLLLLSLAAFSVVSVVAYLVLALLSVTISFRVYKSVIQAVQKSEEGHPFRAYLELDVTLSPEAFQSHATAAMAHVNHVLRLLVHLFLVEDLVDSLKLAVAMWLMTYVGAVFNGITLLILAELLAFTLPPVYEKNKVQIDHYVGIAREQTKSLIAKVQAKLPGLAKKKPE